MKIAFVAICAQGHLNSTTPLARKLKARGHDVVFISLPDAEPFAKAADLPFIPYCGDEYPPGALRAILDELGKLQGEEAFKFTFQALAQALQVSLKHLPRTLKEAGADAVVLDEAQAALALAPLHLGMPYVHFSSAVAFDFSGNTPLCFFDWPHETTPEALARNQEGVRKVLQTFELSRTVAREYAEKAGLKIDWTDPFALISKLAWLTQTPKEFDFPNSHLPKQFHHTGPFHDGVGRIPTEFPWDRLTGDQLIYASMGTVQNGLLPVFNTIAEAVGKSAPDMQLVLSIGPAIDRKQIQSLPPNAIVVNGAPQQEILKRATLCITHAGLNTTLESLMQGVPLVAIPVTNDQPGVAARIAYTKTGKFVPVQQVTAPKLSSLIEEVLKNPVHRRNAQEMKRAIAKTDGLAKAADLIEEAFGLPRKKKEEAVMSTLEC
jgi:zeaxanthin glucosyltransferase